MSFAAFTAPTRATCGFELLDSTTICLMRQPTSYDMAQIQVQGSSPEEVNDGPQRSRNARAQARHRQKRKAYIEKLEENVAKLQAVLGLTSEQVSELPPAAVLTNRFAELEMENRQLHEQLRALQQVLQGGRYPTEGHNGARWSPESPIASDFPQSSLTGSENVFSTRESKKRKLSFEEDDRYTSHDQASLANADLIASSNGNTSRARHTYTQGSVTATTSADAQSNILPLASTYNGQTRATSMDQRRPTIKTEQSSFGDISILSPTTAASPHAHIQNVTGPINIDMEHGHSQAAVRMSFSPTNERILPQQPASSSNSSYSGIVSGAARSIFGSSEEEAYMPTPASSLLDSRTQYDAQQQLQHQQYLAHERLASIAQHGQVQHQGLYHAVQHPTPFSPALTNRVPQLMLGTNGLHHQHPQVGAYGNGHGGGGGSPIVTSPIGGNPWGTASTLVAGKRG